MWNFLKRFLVVSLILCIASSSCFALSFLPSYSTSAESRDTGLLSILRSMQSEKSDASSTPEGEAAELPEEGETTKEAPADPVVEEVPQKASVVPTMPEGTEKRGMIYYTKEEVEEMDKALAEVEKTLAEELDPFHFGLGLSLGWNNLSNLVPSVDFQLRWDDFILNGGVGYAFDIFEGFDNLSFDVRDINARIGVMYEW